MMDKIVQVGAGILIILCDRESHTIKSLLEELFIKEQFITILPYCKERYDEFLAKYPKITERRAAINQVLKTDISHAIKGRKGIEESFGLAKLGLLEDNVQIVNGIAIREGLIEYKIIETKIAEIYSTFKNWDVKGLLEMFVKSKLFIDYFAHIPWTANELVEALTDIINHVPAEIISKEQKFLIQRVPRQGDYKWYNSVNLSRFSPTALEYFLNTVGVPLQEYQTEREIFQQKEGKEQSDYVAMIMAIYKFINALDYQKIHETCQIFFAYDRVKSSLFSPGPGQVLELMDEREYHRFFYPATDMETRVFFGSKSGSYLGLAEFDEETRFEREHIAFQSGVMSNREAKAKRDERMIWAIPLNKNDDTNTP